MDLNEAMQQLEALGSDQTRKTWCRHGAATPMFGVKFGDLAKLQKRIKVDQRLASELWQTGNHDARLLACMVADATTITEKELKAWASGVKDSSTAEALASFASRTPMAAKLREAWLYTRRHSLESSRRPRVHRRECAVAWREAFRALQRSGCSHWPTIDTTGSHPPRGAALRDPERRGDSGG
jgi:3-methyladenine DNA glycosylase AlkD